MKFYAHLHDSHGYVTGDTVTAEFGAGIPFELGTCTETSSLRK